jgi:hypothetical protein
MIERRMFVIATLDWHGAMVYNKQAIIILEGNTI